MKPGDIKTLIDRALRGVRQPLRATLTRLGALKRVILAQAAGVDGESFQNAELLQQAGFRSVPLVGTQVVIVPLNGSSANAVIVATANGAKYVADLAPGEVAVFNETDGHSIVLRNGKLIEINCDTLRINASVGVEINTPDVQASGAIHAAVDVIAAGISAVHHDHGNVQNGAGRTSPPG
jgi:phage baseplate assembly protein V